MRGRKGAYPGRADKRSDHSQTLQRRVEIRYCQTGSFPPPGKREGGVEERKGKKKETRLAEFAEEGIPGDVAE